MHECAHVWQMISMYEYMYVCVCTDRVQGGLLPNKYVVGTRGQTPEGRRLRPIEPAGFAYKG